jgi:hypothetical protein
MAERLGLEGVAFRPALLHVAFAAPGRLSSVDAERQGRLEALLRDLAHLSPLEATRAVAEGRVLKGGESYEWEADEMVVWLDGSRPDPTEVARERERTRFTTR